jgi:hypothetical protein
MFLIFPSFYFLGTVNNDNSGSLKLRASSDKVIDYPLKTIRSFLESEYILLLKLWLHSNVHFLVNLLDQYSHHCLSSYSLDSLRISFYQADILPYLKIFNEV